MALPRGYISHSQIRIYNDCPRKYYFAYVEEIEPAVSDKLLLGEVFHSTIERYFLQRMDGESPEAEGLFSLFGSLFDEAAAARRITWQSPPREARERGLAFLKYFLAHLAPAVRPLMVEKELCVELPGSGVMLKGVIDLVEEDYCITDFKTTTGRWTPSRARHSPQMLIYKYLFDNSFGPVSSGLKYEILYGRSAAAIRHQTLRVDAPDEAVDGLLAMIHHVAAKISDGVFQPNVTDLCRFCEFRTLCRERGRG